MALSQDHRDALTEYVGLGERALEPVFVGRESFFDRVRSASAAALRGVPGTTMCLYGPPGVGKTAFIAALEQRQREDDSLPQVVRVAPGELREPRYVLRRVASAIFADDSEAEKVVRWFTGGLESLEVGVGPIKAKFLRPSPGQLWTRVGAWCGSLRRWSYVPIPAASRWL